MKCFVLCALSWVSVKRHVLSCLHKCRMVSLVKGLQRWASRVFNLKKVPGGSIRVAGALLWCGGEPPAPEMPSGVFSVTRSVFW